MGLLLIPSFSPASAVFASAKFNRLSLPVHIRKTIPLYNPSKIGLDRLQSLRETYEYQIDYCLKALGVLWLATTPDALSNTGLNMSEILEDLRNNVYLDQLDLDELRRSQDMHKNKILECIGHLRVLRNPEPLRPALPDPPTSICKCAAMENE